MGKNTGFSGFGDDENPMIEKNGNLQTVRTKGGILFKNRRYFANEFDVRIKDTVIF